MIQAKLANLQRRPYADTVYEYEVTATGMTAEEVLQHCKTEVHRASVSEKDNRAFGQTFYKFLQISDHKFRYTVIVPNCD